VKRSTFKKQSLLVNTNIFIDYLSSRKHRSHLESERWRIFYAAVTKRESLAKQGLSDQERQAIFLLLGQYRQIFLTQAIASRYDDLRQQYPTPERGDALIAATALVHRLPLLTGNVRHFRIVAGINLLSPYAS